MNTFSVLLLKKAYTSDSRWICGEFSLSSLA